MAFIDTDFPNLLGSELLRPDGNYIAKFVFQPLVVHDFSAIPGGVVQLDRYGYWSDTTYTEDSRERTATQIIGSAGSRNIPKEKVLVTLKEFTGPSSGDPSNTSDPGNLKIPMMTLMTAMRNLYDTGNANVFHQSIGSITLFQDYRKWQDRVYINRALTANTVGLASGTEASSSSGGYYNPDGIANGGTYATGPQKFDVLNDLLQVVSDMRTRNVPPFSSPMGPVYHCLASPTFMRHLRQDETFREIAQYPGPRAIPIEMMSPGMSAMSAPQMPAPFMDWSGAPNQLAMQGGFYGQSGFMSGEYMPTGFVFEGVRFFESNNLPTVDVTLTYTAAVTGSGASTGAATRTGHVGIFIGQQAIGEGVWGQGPTVQLNENSDYNRFLIAIWQQYSGYATLNSNFVTIGRTFEN